MKNMKNETTCTMSNQDRIKAQLQVIENIMKAPTEYENAQRNIEEAIEELCKKYPKYKLYINNEYGLLCGKYGLDWY